MNINEYTKFFDSEEFTKLCDEASDNPNAMELLEVIDLVLKSAIFFHELDEHGRVDREIKQLDQLTKLITNLYE